MTDNPVEDHGNGRELMSFLRRLLVEERAESALTAKWPKAWRVVFLFGVGLASWAALLALVLFL